MAGFQITITTAGRAALVNAANTGTAPVQIAQVGLTATAFAPAAGLVDLPAELKRLATIAGEVVADDTVHVSVKDESADTYTVRGFGLYLQDGTLFAVYGQAGPIIEKSVEAILLLALDVIFTDIAATALTFGDASWTNPPATEDRAGVVELATEAEGTGGLDALRAVTARVLKAVLDARFGAGAPSAFVKGLLTSASQAAFRTALALKSAALKDEGAGAGLDADLLDGQHGAYYLAWANLTGRPLTFAPSAHTHDAADVTSGVFLVARIPALDAAKITSGVFDPARIPGLDAAKIATGTIDPARIPILPSQKQLASAGDLTALTALQQADIGQGTVVTTTDGFRWVYSGAGSKTSAASYTQLADITPDWSAISNKPLTFTPAAHTHAAADVTSGVFSTARLPTATTAAQGIARLATTAEALAGALADCAVTPAGLSGAVDQASPVGQIGFFSGATAPAGWVKANGALLSRTTYARLWVHAQASGNLAASDAAWSAGKFSPGDGVSTFRIPDHRAEFPRGWDDGRGVDVGRAIGSWQADELKSHTHSILNTGGAAGDGIKLENDTSTQPAQDINTGATGGVETRPRNIAWLACIRY